MCFVLSNLFKNLNLCTNYVKQIMFSHSCNGTNIFIRWKMKCTIQLSFAMLNGTFSLSRCEKTCSIALTNIQYLYTIVTPWLAGQCNSQNFGCLCELWCHIALKYDSRVDANVDLEVVYKCIFFAVSDALTCSEIRLDCADATLATPNSFKLGALKQPHRVVKGSQIWSACMLFKNKYDRSSTSA